MAPYRVQLDTYNGPLDLLLYLIRREEVDIYDIPIARITGQYIEYVNVLKLLDPDGVAEYLVLLATLIEIKSRTLLPRGVVEEDEAEDLQDPRMDLVRRLLEYKRFKDASRALGVAAEEHAKRFPARPVQIERQPGELELEEAQIWDLMAAFNRLMAEIGRAEPIHEVVYDDTPMALHAADIIDRLQREGGSLAFERIFLGRGRGEVIGLFLALLEMVRQKRVRAERQGLFGMLVIHLLDAAPLEIAHAEPSDGNASDLAEKTEDLSSADEHGAAPRAAATDEDWLEGESDAELEAIDLALDRVAGRLEEDRLRRRAADAAAPGSITTDGESA